MPERPDLDARFESPDGDVRTRENIALVVRHEDADVKRVEDGFLVNGVRYVSVEE